MNKQLPIYKFVIKEGDELNFGVDAVALVDEPAIERYFVAFNKNDNFQFRVTNEEKRIITGAAMIADLPIYRADSRGEYYAVFDAATIQQCVLRFFSEGLNKNVNMMHGETDKVSGVTLFESFIIDTERGISAPKGFASAPDGSWFCSYYVANDEVWQMVKNGTFKGFSIEGHFEQLPIAVTDESAILSIIDSIQE